MPKTILITGGAGFIGSHVTDQLAARGYSVHVVDDLSTGWRQYVHPKAELHVMDIRSSGLTRLMRRLRPHSVVHLAAHIDLRSSFENPASDADTNIMGSLNVLASCAAAGVTSMVFASSAAVYSSALKRMPVAEDDLKDPDSPYGIGKYAFELYLRSLARSHGISAAALRFANVYGPRQTAKGEAGAVAIFAQKLLRGETPVVNGHGRQTRDYVYVGDVARMVATAAARQLEGTFNVGTARETSVNALYAAIAKSVGSRVKAKHGPAKPGDDKRLALDARRARRTVGWKAEVELEEGIDAAVEWMRRSLGAGKAIR